MALVVIDAGHGGANPGAVYGGRREKDDVLALSMEVGNILERNGVDVYYTITSDVYESPAQKTEEANAVRGDYFVSIHRNSSPYPNQYTGVESLVYNRYGEAARLAENINARLEELGFANQGVNERKDLVVLSGSQMPAVLDSSIRIATTDFLTNVSMTLPRPLQTVSLPQYGAAEEWRRRRGGESGLEVDCPSGDGGVFLGNHRIPEDSWGGTAGA